MAIKTANVIARIEPDIKEQAESIMAALGIPTSVVINMLYKQIVLTKGIPFALRIPRAPVSHDEMDVAAFNTMMEHGLDDAFEGRSRPASEVFSEQRQEIV